MPCCSAVGCSNRSEKGFRLFKFPANPCRRQVWILNCRRNNWTPTKSSFLCEMHFEPHQYEQNRVDGRKLLKPFAVPTIFNHDFKPQKLKEQVNYRPSAMNSVVTPLSAAIDHTYTIQNNANNTPKEKQLFSKLITQDQDTSQTTIVELSFESFGVTSDEHIPAMELNNEEGSDSLEKILKLWEDQSHLDLPREDGLREILNESQLQNSETEISLTDCLPVDNCELTTTSKLEAKIKKLELQLRLLKKDQKRKKNPIARNKDKTIDLNNLYKLAEKGNNSAKFILDQAIIVCRKNKSRKWSELTLQNCLYWKLRSPRGYNSIYKKGFLNLPSRHLLKKFIGYSKGNKCLSSAMMHHLKQSTKWSSSALLSLIVEDMRIKHCSRKSIDFFLGSDACTATNEVRLMCVQMKELITGLSTLIGFFPITNLNGKTVSKLITNLIGQVETCGVIMQIVFPHTMFDIFQYFDDGDYSWGKVKHPVDAKRILFLKCDPNFIIQEVYQKFLAKDVTFREGCISARYLQMLSQDVESDMKAKLPKVISSEKVNSSNANVLFSAEHCKALNRLNLMEHSNYADVGPTVEFIDTLSRWLSVQNGLIGSDLQRNADWLENDVILYVEEIEKSCRENKVTFLSEFLLHAFKFSTKSMAMFLSEVKRS